jgi:hypothetical protein
MRHIRPFVLFTTAETVSALTPARSFDRCTSTLFRLSVSACLLAMLLLAACTKQAEVSTGIGPQEGPIPNGLCASSTPEGLVPR